MHDRMCHPGYMLAQMGVKECEHENKTHYVKIVFEEGLLPFNVGYCNECYNNLSDSERNQISS
jgi:hypothetical protein